MYLNKDPLKNQQIQTKKVPKRPIISILFK